MSRWSEGGGWLGKVMGLIIAGWRWLVRGRMSAGGFFLALNPDNPYYPTDWSSGSVRNPGRKQDPGIGVFFGLWLPGRPFPFGGESQRVGHWPIFCFTAVDDAFGTQFG